MSVQRRVKEAQKEWLWRMVVEVGVGVRLTQPPNFRTTYPSANLQFYKTSQLDSRLSKRTPSSDHCSGRQKFIMYTLKPPSSQNLRQLLLSRSSIQLLPASVVSVQCAYRSDSVRFPNGVAGSRSHWLSSCAILASKVVSIEESTEKIFDGSADRVLSVNGREARVEDLNIVSIGKLSHDGVADVKLQPKPLTIADLAPAPMHGSYLRVAYQGVPGAYSEAAAGKAYPNCEAIPCDQFEVAFQAVELWIDDRAVLPVENSFGGSIHRNYDLLLRHRLHIVGEVQLLVHHCLLTLPDVRKEYLTRVISHPQALAQCENSLTKLGLNVVREAVDDTSGAAEFVAAQNLRNAAAIASERAAELYGLQVLADGIQDDSSNTTRFLMLAREPIIPRTDRLFKTSIVFAHDGRTSVLFKVLSAFAFRNISLTKIESRPHRNQPITLIDDTNKGTAKHFRYLFYVDFEASMADVRAQNALAEVQEFTSFLRVLGSYPVDMTPWSPSMEED